MGHALIALWSARCSASDARSGAARRSSSTSAAPRISRRPSSGTRSSGRRRYISGLGRAALLDSVEYADEIFDLGGREDAIDAARIEVGIGRFVEQGRFHGPVLNEVLDDHVHEFDLIGLERLARQEAGKRLLGRFPVQT